MKALLQSVDETSCNVLLSTSGYRRLLRNGKKRSERAKAAEANFARSRLRGAAAVTASGDILKAMRPVEVL
jgi:hypothetical protein